MFNLFVVLTVILFRICHIPCWISDALMILYGWFLIGCTADELSRIMDQLHVFITIKPKPKQPTNVMIHIYILLFQNILKYFTVFLLSDLYFSRVLPHDVPKAAVICPVSLILHIFMWSGIQKVNWVSDLWYIAWGLLSCVICHSFCGFQSTVVLTTKWLCLSWFWAVILFANTYDVMLLDVEWVHEQFVLITLFKSRLKAHLFSSVYAS